MAAAKKFINDPDDVVSEMLEVSRFALLMHVNRSCSVCSIERNKVSVVPGLDSNLIYDHSSGRDHRVGVPWRIQYILWPAALLIDQ